MRGVDGADNGEQGVDSGCSYAAFGVILCRAPNNGLTDFALGESIKITCSYESMACCIMHRTHSRAD